MRIRLATLGCFVALLAACRPATSDTLSPARRAAIADTVKQRIMAAADLSHGDVVPRLMSLYPDTGTVISASAGRVTTTRAALERSITAFWQNIGQNMRDPKWEWGEMHIDVLAPDVAVLTATYRIPHLTPRGAPHIVGGAWTAVFQRRNGKWVIVQEHLSDFPPIG
jgi:ketosteroid isomerase-like protein